LALLSICSTWKEKLQASSSSSSPSTELVYGELLQLQDCTSVNDCLSAASSHQEVPTWTPFAFMF
jgi:hypothetical protein